MIKIGNIELPEFPLLLAPMEDVSDPPFRRLCKMHGADLMYSEFISSEMPQIFCKKAAALTSTFQNWSIIMKPDGGMMFLNLHRII